MSVACIAVAVLGSAIGQQTQLGPEAEALSELRFLKIQVAEFTLFRPQNLTAPLPLLPEAVLRYSNPLGGGQAGGGATFLWVERTRPVAALSLSIRPADNRVYVECASLGQGDLACVRGEMPFWTPKSGGLIPQSLNAAPSPAASAPLRLAQMRDIARRFSAATYTQADVRTELRLLTTPLYRFTDDTSGVLDGALFAFAVSNDPELFLLLEAIRARNNDAARWRYSLARMSSRRETVSLDDKETWSVGNFYREPPDDRTSGPYIEARLGAYKP
jgi:hypothetical protein